MENVPDHPDIARALRTGYPYGQEEHSPICPRCGDECGTYYVNEFGRIIGCDNCIKEVDAWEWDDCHRKD